MLSYQYRKSHCGYRRSYERLISTTRFPILVRWHLYIDPGPRPHDLPKYSVLSTRLNMTPTIPDSKAHGANMEPIWGRQDPGGPHVGPMNFAIWEPIIMLVEPNLQSTWAHDPNLEKIFCPHFKNNNAIRTCFCTCVTTYVNLHLVWVIRITITSNINFAKFQSRAYKLSVKWVPNHSAKDSAHVFVAKYRYVFVV